MFQANENLVHFAVDTRKSLLTVQAFASGIISVVAHSPKFAVRDFSGEAQFVPGSMQHAAVKLTISLGSLEIMDEVSSADRREIERIMFEEVLEKDRFPIAKYQSTRVLPPRTGQNLYRVSGDLAFHGVTREIDFDAQILATEETLRAQGSFSVVQSQFGLKIASIAGGSLKLKDELKCAYFIVGNRLR